jgi:hypothetical protein
MDELYAELYQVKEKPKKEEKKPEILILDISPKQDNEYQL